MVKSEQRPMLRFLIVQTAASVVGLQCWMILFNNFAVEIAGLDGFQVGVIGSVREIPGFLALLAVFVMLVIREHRLSALSVIFLGIGTALTGFFPSFIGLIITTLIMSFGFHYYETTNQSLTLQYFDNATSPLIFGRLRSLAAATSILVGLLLFLMGLAFSYKVMFLLVGSLVAVAGIWGLLQDPTHRNLVPQHRKMILRRRYSLYYFLTFMAGARRQIFMAFSVYLLVKVFECTVTEITLLFVANNAVNFFLSPLIGRAIVRFGERRVLSIEYGGLIAIFLVYAFIDIKGVIVVMYILDHILFNFSIAIRTYFQKVADPQDIAPSMAVGFTINHIAAVVMPVIGGALWMVDYRIPFVVGAIFSMVSLLAVQRIPSAHRVTSN
ncbi:MAG: MFS transporter [Desulfuromonadales bacterium]|jgi:predicted MFS family arabinose efflux permease|nr:MFS transporter [Desulfuromonadales bacterium]MDH3809804.1 MFS transporter [Desulfuromonadales bacterium]MDH3869158.1 MFS transporter [Desulfuromonadales bacterium]MDH4025170.1 MFS transporter [Desulfuromonadales bacterium]